MEKGQVNKEDDNDQNTPPLGERNSEKATKGRKPRVRKEKPPTNPEVVKSELKSSEAIIMKQANEEPDVLIGTMDTDVTTDNRKTTTESISVDIKTHPTCKVFEQPITHEENPSLSDMGAETLVAENTKADEELDMLEIPPVKQIRDLLAKFEMRVPVWGLTVFTLDGYILAHRLFYDGMPDNIEFAVSSMSAGLITISQDFLHLVSSNSLFRQVLIDADDEAGAVSFSIVLKSVAENVLLTCIFPSNIKLGLVSFEIENLSKDMNEIIGLWDVKLHEETVT